MSSSSFTVQKSSVELVWPALMEHCNTLSLVKEGYLLKLIDVLGAYSALKYLDNQLLVVTASLDRTNFVHPIKVWDRVVMEAHVTQVWNTSMEIAVNVDAIDMRTADMARYHVATAKLIYVGLDKERKPVHLPFLTVDGSSQQEAEAELADLRKASRFEEQDAAPWVALSLTDSPWWVETTREMTPSDANLQGNVFGGVILEQLAQTGRQAAKQQCMYGAVVGARMDRVNFLSPGFIGETIRCRALVTRTWRTSVEVQVELVAVNPNEPEAPRLIAQCYLVYVRMSPLGLPTDVPPWNAKTPEQELRLAGADIRRANRHAERALVDSTLKAIQ
ncbi:MAG: hotdog domain-containing protein [Vampirovibrionales bacterium]|nr:hotdog domain-containing protein [Vampirovibrionales bacterium]